MTASADEEHGEDAAADSIIGSGRRKTAVIVIHGMGEQRPMETISGFVTAIWTRDDTITNVRNRTIYSKPDTITGSFELRRITTRNAILENDAPKRVDFFEFYWAHLMTGNTIGGILWWLKDLLVRNPATVPPRLRRAWYLALFVVALCLLVAISSGNSELLSKLLTALHLPPVPAIVGLSISAAAVLLGALGTIWIVPVAGDAARYLSPRPDNVAARQNIREAGVDLLGKLQASGHYDRIVVVGHSLGSVIGYDVLSYAWGRLREQALLDAHADKSEAQAALNALEKAAGALAHADDAQKGAARVEYRALQRAYQHCLCAARLWAVTDFVTLGSPLSKADVLIARDARGFDERKAARELPTSPPAFEKNEPSRKLYRFSYPVTKPVRIPHHASVFAPVVWTNIFFGTVGGIFGDPIAGPVRNLFGRGVVDVRIPARPFSFLHTTYWNVRPLRKKRAAADAEPKPDDPALRALRRAGNLKLLNDAELWGDQSAAEEIQAALLS